MRIVGLTKISFRGQSWWQRVGKTLLILGVYSAMWAPFDCQASPRGVEVRNLGLSRQGERTMLTVILDQAANPQVAPITGVDRSQIMVDFPGAWAKDLPDRLPGDDVLIKNVRTEVTGTGVKIILEMFPERPYTMTREIRPLIGRRAMFLLGLQADPAGAQAKRPPAAAMPEPQAQKHVPPVTPAPPEPSARPLAKVEPTGTFSELSQLMPQAKGLFEFLREDGWTVAKAQSYDRPGQRFSRGFNLTNPKYPEMSVRVAHLPPNASGAPSINIIDLSIDKLGGQASDEYRNLRQWNFAKIKTKFEDIGDFFDEALKPLREKIRRHCQDLALRHSQFFTKFLQQAVPQNPKIADEAITLIRKKVSPRFEGVQYTLSENPLVILNLVDFLYIRIYYILGG